MGDQSQGNTPPEGANGEGEPKFVLASEVATIVNSAVTSQLKRMLPKELETVRAGFSSDLDKKLEAFKPKETQGESNPGKPSPEVAALQAKIDELVATNKATAEKADKAERSRREDAAYGSLRSMMKDVRPEMVDIAVDVVRARNLLSFDDEGRPLFRVRRAPAPGLSEEDQNLPLADGVAHFLKSKDAAPFLPAPVPKPPAGNGSPRGGAQTPTTTQRADDGPAKTDAEKVRRAAVREAEILERMKNNGPQL